MAFVGTALAANDYTWTGAGASATWSTGANWSGGAGPTGTVGTLTFPQLTSAACTVTTPAATCYDSSDDSASSSPVTANALSIDDNQRYDIAGTTGFSLGAGGITAAPDGADRAGGDLTTIDDPITLTADQTWSIDGGPDGDDGLLLGSVTGGGNLAINFIRGATLGMNGNAGGITATGPGTLVPTSGTEGQSDISTDGGFIDLDDRATLDVPNQNTTVGTLFLDDGSLKVGTGEAPEPTLGIGGLDGSLTLADDSTLSLFIDQAGTAAGTDFSGVQASGLIDISGASLHLAQGANAEGACVDLKPGDVDTIVGSTGTFIGPFVTGTFTGVPDGTIVPIANECDSDSGAQSATAKINYTGTSVTATIVSGGTAGDVPQSIRPPVISGTPAAGDLLTATTGTWSGSPTGYLFQWLQCTGTGTACRTLVGATNSTYTPAASDVGDRLEVTVTAENGSGSAAATSSPTAVIATPPETTSTTTSSSTTPTPTTTSTTSTSTPTPISPVPAPAPAPTTSTTTSTPSVTPPKLASVAEIHGSLVVGQILHATGETFTGSEFVLADEWELCTTTAASSCQRIGGARRASYRLTAADAGHRIRFLAVALNRGGVAEGTSSATGEVLSPADVRSGLATLLGPSGSAATLANMIKSDGYAVRYAAPAPGLLTVTWEAHIGRKDTVLATYSRSLSTSGIYTVKAALTTAGTALFKQDASAKRALKLTTTVSYRLATLAAITADGPLTLRP